VVLGAQLAFDRASAQLQARLVGAEALNVVAQIEDCNRRLRNSIEELIVGSTRKQLDVDTATP
jgi:uncharacterized membrane protein YqjE